MKEIINTQRYILNRRHLLLLGMLVLLGLLSSCTTCKLIKMMLPHKVSHAGFSVVVPGDWGDCTDTNKEQLAVARIWGSVSFSIEKMPGESASDLALCRRTFSGKVNHGREEVITQWNGFKGHGFRFRDDAIETVLFFPEGNYLGWYIRADVSNDEKGSRTAFEQVIHSLKREVNSSDKP